MSEEVETIKRRYFLLHGWARYLSQVAEVEKQMDAIKRFRKEDNVERRADGGWGILVEEDYWALQYQRLHFRVARAHRAVRKDISRTYRFTGNGPLTFNMFGAAIPGWETDPEDVAIKNDREMFDRNYRSKAHHACELLKGMDGEYDHRRCCDEKHHNEALMDACR